jgi:DNA polymerase zeta
MAPPLVGFDVCWSELHGGAVNRVPVVRVFGATPAGQRACVHLHKAFPYLYVPYGEDLPQEPKEGEEGGGGGISHLSIFFSPSRFLSFSFSSVSLADYTA